MAPLCPRSKIFAELFDRIEIKNDLLVVHPNDDPTSALTIVPDYMEERII